jgi:hypothetical protein
MLLQLLASQLGVGVGGSNNASAGSSILDTGASSAYSTRAAYGYGNFRGANL